MLPAREFSLNYDLLTQQIRFPHKPHDLFIHIIRLQNAEVMIELVASRHLSDFLETQVVFVRLVERKHHMDKILPELRHPRNPLAAVRNPDHGFGWFNDDLANGRKTFHEMIE